MGLSEALDGQIKPENLNAARFSPHGMYVSYVNKDGKNDQYAYLVEGRRQTHYLVVTNNSAALQC